ncbi:MAG: hypothetical protein HKM94_11045 [Halobacteria archaeon]|nr:hypothetical protein [Halobacteria archaeon]
MAEITEKIAKAVGHKHPIPECPFCPIEEPEDFTTYPGIDNDSTALGNIMEDPDLLTSEQDNCRPKDDGGPKRQKKSDPQRKPNPIHACVIDGVAHVYSCEAHHAISGKQAMNGELVEQWISKEQKQDYEIVKDTGYSINNADNGIWLPSLPEHLKGGGWGNIKDKEKRKDIAFRVMRAENLQWHKGPHNISDKDGLFDDDDEIVKYDRWLKDELDEIHGVIVKWTDECEETKKRKEDGQELTANHKVHDMLDALSKIVRTLKVKGAPSTWRIFVSRLAMECAAEDKPPTRTSFN